MYTYNWTNDMFNSMSKYMTRLINWSNARAHLLNSIVTQKMGLYNHYLFGDISSTMVSANELVHGILFQYSPFITHTPCYNTDLDITWLPNVFNMEFYKGITVKPV